jgi:hypothetical protein
MKRILCVLIAVLCLCTCWAGNGKKPIVWEQPIAESNQLFYDPFQSQLNIYRVELLRSLYVKNPGNFRLKVSVITIPVETALLQNILHRVQNQPNTAIIIL